MNSLKPLDNLWLVSLSVEELEAEIQRHNHLYWDQAQPEISDHDYDRLVRRLTEVAPDSPVLQELGPAEVGRIGNAVTHAAPMLSLDKCYAFRNPDHKPGDLYSWAFSVARGEVKGPRFEGRVVVTPKMDGIAASLRYNEDGHLVQAATRGSGVEGDDITANVRTIEDIPNHLAEPGIEVRGEIYMRLSVFAGFEEQFSNPRNLTAGAIKQKDPRGCARYGLSFMAYDLIGTDLTSEVDKLERLQDLGFSIPESLILDKDELQQGYTHFASQREALDFEIDGVVFKVNRVAEQQRMGATAHHPRYAIAYKFQAEKAITTLQRVEWSVARSGAITPVALVEPVTLSGASVSRASLHHVGFLEEPSAEDDPEQGKRKLGLLGRHSGARVEVSRRGDVIPKVEQVIEHPDPPLAGATRITLPEACPSCGGGVRREGDFLYCQRPEQCRHATIGALAYFCKVVDIQGFGEKLLAQAYDHELIRSPADLYALTAEDLLGLERVGQKLAEKLIQEVDSHRQMPLATFLRALGIEELGPHVSGIMARRYGSLLAARAATAEELAAIHSVGEVIAQKVVSGLLAAAPQIELLVQQVTVLEEEAGADTEADAVAGPLAGQSFVFTGKLLELKRKQAQQQVKALGGEAPAGVIKTLTYLVVGDGGEQRKSSKRIKAEKNIEAGAATRIITESDFRKLMRAVENDPGRPD